MERNDKTNSILRQFKRKSKRIVNKDQFTEFFYINKDRQAIEFLYQDEKLLLDIFFKQFIQSDFREFVEINLLNDSEEPLRVWYYDEENLVIVLKVNWGFKKQEISVDIDMENFKVTLVDEDGFAQKKLDHNLINDFIISFVTNQAKALSETYEKITKREAK